MGKQTKSKRSENAVGKGKVTPVQVAFIVDRYLSDNNFVRTRSVFRSEASLLISKSPVNEAPKSLLSLGDMLDEYICLKEQKVILNQEKNRLEQEKLRVQTLLRGMQDAMNAYNVGGASASASAAAPLPSPVVMPLLSAGNTMASPAPSFPMYNTPVMMSTTRPSNSSEPTNFSTPITTQPASKRRKTTKDLSGAPLASKRTRTQPSTTQLNSSGTTKLVSQPTTMLNNQETVLQITSVPSTTKSSLVQGSSVAKCLFNPSSSSPGPQTPSPSPIDKSISPVINQTPPSSNKKTMTPQQFTSTNRTVITSETIQVSPMKQVSYYSIERNHCISSPMKSSSQRFGKRDHVKGRLDFDGSEMAAVNSEMITSDENTGSPSEIEDNAFDFDLPNLDCLGVDFNLTDLLGDFDLDGDRLDYFCQPASGSSPESLSGSPDTMVGGITGDRELLSGMSSTMTEIRSEQGMNMPGPNSRTSVKSITKCIKVFSPVKSRKSTGSDHETCGVEEKQEQLISC